MLSNNIKNLRKQKGYSQETLAQELNVVRQTVSKWEKGYSVPDAVMLEKIAELFEVGVSDLLGDSQSISEQKAELEQLASQLAILNNQIAREVERKRKHQKIRNIVLICILAVFFLFILIALVPVTLFGNPKTFSHGDASNVMIIPEESDMYTFDQIDAAINVVRIDFETSWKGCTLTEIRYAGDEESREEIKSRGAETMVLLSTIETDRNAKDSSMNSPYTYTDFKWILIKDKNGDWIHVDHGYG